jgi:hypothetical protein
VDREANKNYSAKPEIQSLIVYKIEQIDEKGGN